MKQVPNLSNLIVPAIILILTGTLPNIIDMDFFLAYIIKWPKVILFIIVLLTLISLWLYRHNNEDKSQRTSITFKSWKHSILICDDQAKVLATISDGLKGYDYDYVTLKDLSDYRLATNFEIIIGDIFGLGATKDSISVLNTIKEKFPYKVVIAMSASTVNESPEDLRKDIPFVQKDREMKYVKDLRDFIKKYSAELDNVDEHWKKTSETLSLRNVDAQMIETHKKNYYNFINSLMD